MYQYTGGKKYIYKPKYEVNMKSLVFPLAILFLSSSCGMKPDSNKHDNDLGKNKVYKLQLNPTAGSKYYFDISNESEAKLEIKDKNIDNLAKTKVGVYYELNKDSSGNFMINMTYDKIHLYTKNGDSESDLDAANAATSLDPLEKILGILKAAHIVAIISPAGEIKSATGYKEMVAKIIAGMNNNDIYAKNIAQSKWEKLIEEGMIKKNMNQLFKIFPDSALHVGDKWKINSTQNSEINLNANTSYTLKEINDGIAIIDSEADITSDSSSSNYFGYEVTTDLNGEGKGEYDMEVRTGILIKANITTNVKGELQMLGREIPVNIRTIVKIKGRKVK